MRDPPPVQSRSRWGGVRKARAITLQAAADARAAQADGPLGGKSVAQQDRAANLRGIGGKHDALAVVAPIDQTRPVHIERPGNAGTHQPDDTCSDEAIAQDDHTVDPSGLGADRIALPSTDPCPARNQVARDVRGIQDAPPIAVNSPIRSMLPRISAPDSRSA